MPRQKLATEFFQLWVIPRHSRDHRYVARCNTFDRLCKIAKSIASLQDVEGTYIRHYWMNGQKQDSAVTWTSKVHFQQA